MGSEFPILLDGCKDKKEILYYPEEIIKLHQII